MTKRRKQLMFLARVASCARTTIACRGLADFSTFYKWRKEDPDFAREWDEALDTALDAIEIDVHGSMDDRTRRWILSRRRPNKYGDHANVTPEAGDKRIQIELEGQDED